MAESAALNSWTNRSACPYQGGDPAEYSPAEQEVEDEHRGTVVMLLLIGDQRREEVECDKDEHYQVVFSHCFASLCESMMRRIRSDTVIPSRWASFLSHSAWRSVNVTVCRMVIMWCHSAPLSRGNLSWR